MNDARAKKFVDFARQVAEDEASWADWHNRVFGMDGEFKERFQTREERSEFIDSTYQVQVEQISKSLRDGVPITEYTIPTR